MHGSPGRIDFFNTIGQKQTVVIDRIHMDVPFATGSLIGKKRSFNLELLALVTIIEVDD